MTKSEIAARLDEAKWFEATCGNTACQSFCVCKDRIAQHERALAAAPAETCSHGKTGDEGCSLCAVAVICPTCKGRGMVQPSESYVEPTKHKDKLTHENTVLGCVACDLTDTDHVEGAEVDDPRPPLPGPKKCPWCRQVLAGSTERISESSAGRRCCNEPKCLNDWPCKVHPDGH